MRFYSKEDTQQFDRLRFLYIKTSLEGHVFSIMLNRPEKRNAFTPTMAAEITFALAYAHYQAEIWCVVVKAEGPVFCAGADLGSFHDPAADTKNNTLPESREEIRLGDAFSDLCKPCIAQVEGPVLAGGFLLICGCIFVLSVNDAAFSLPEVKRGLWPMQVMASLLKIIPARKVLEMSVTGKSYSAAEAYELGLVTQIVERGKMAEEVKGLAELICSNAPYAIQAGMQAFQNLPEIPDHEQHKYLKSQLDKILLSEDAREGTLAFKEKRKPVWKGR